MRISTKGRYALRMLIDLAEHKDGGYVSLKDIAERQGISKKYLEQIISVFNQTDLLKANRGAQGGYMLAKPEENITVGEVLRLTEGTLSPAPCIDQCSDGCERSADCATLPVWQGLYKVINDYLDGITLRDIVEQKREHDVFNYVI